MTETISESGLEPGEDDRAELAGGEVGETVRRWLLQTAALVWVGVAAAGVGLVATATPQGWAPWVGAVAIGLVAGLAWQLRAATRRS